MKAIADVKALIPQYKSKAEGTFAGFNTVFWHAYLGSDLVLLLYEPCRWAISGGHYTPDFMAVLEDGRMVFVEVKGSKKQRNYRDARSKLRAAVEIYPFFTWIEVVEENGWPVEVLDG